MKLLYAYLFICVIICQVFAPYLRTYVLCIIIDLENNNHNAWHLVVVVSLYTVVFLQCAPHNCAFHPSIILMTALMQLSCRFPSSAYHQPVQKEIIREFFEWVITWNNRQSLLLQNTLWILKRDFFFLRNVFCSDV